MFLLPQNIAFSACIITRMEHSIRGMNRFIARWRRRRRRRRCRSVCQGRSSSARGRSQCPASSPPGRAARSASGRRRQREKERLRALPEWPGGSACSQRPSLRFSETPTHPARGCTSKIVMGVPTRI